MTMIQLLFYAGLLIAGLVAAWFYREELKAAWQKLLAELRELWNAWFGNKKAPEELSSPAAVEPPPVPFAAFADPFATGDAGRMSWPQLVRYTFDALEAWGREQGCPRAPGQTPQEFALALAAIEPQITGQLQSLAASYNQLAYAPRSPTAASPQPLRELWHSLRDRQANLVIA